ncbi:nicotinamide riboside transporter PnuC [Chitinilyticum litopenaei]|uniref:nicotinamide riboside transporter PnuC n=1 Tax=Chitinilyticum litopenaei TaxID=1121276 RepID=UPI00041C9F8E|nr:nicotinamide riboside transporter PnuC [Chitinilyticum litopenaei]
MSLPEIAGFILTLLAITLAARGHVLTWPLQLVASALYVALFLEYHLFGEAALQGIYAVLAIYGWWHWWHGTAQHALPVSCMSRREMLLLGTAAALATLALAQFQIHFLPTDVPVLDSAIFCFGLLAQWLQAQKRLENWACWIVLDLLAAGIYVHKALYLTAVLYVLLAILAAWGWRRWQRELAA